AHAGPTSGRPAAMIPLADLAARAEAAWGHPPASIEIQNPGDAAAVAELQPSRERLGRNVVPIRLSAVTGSDLPGTRPASAPETTRDVMVQLHAGWFAAPVLRWLYFLAGVSGTVMVASGLILWTVKRRAKLPDPARPHFGFRLVERLNIGVIAGATGGIAVYFLANRLLPLDLANRAAWEIHSLFIAWGALFMWSLGRPARRAWAETLAASAMLYAAVPAIGAVTTGRGLIRSLLAGDWLFVGFDLVMLVSAALLTLAARRMARHSSKTATRRAARAAMEAVA
ncbi:MAG: PepSY-associated TM helix domain-containing protein, partial [Sphingobium sp.]